MHPSRWFFRERSLSKVAASYSHPRTAVLASARVRYLTGVDRRRIRVGHHHRAGLRVHRLDLADAVVLLDRRGQLVPPDAVGPVVGDRGDRRKPGLRAPLPGEAIDVIGGRGIADEDALADIATRSEWRDRRLMALAAHKRAMEQGEE